MVEREEILVSDLVVTTMKHLVDDWQAPLQQLGSMSVQPKSVPAPLSWQARHIVPVE